MKIAYMSESASIEVIALRTISNSVVGGSFGKESRAFWVWCGLVWFCFDDKISGNSIGLVLIHHSGPLKDENELQQLCEYVNANWELTLCSTAYIWTNNESLECISVLVQSVRPLRAASRCFVRFAAIESRMMETMNHRLNARSWQWCRMRNPSVANEIPNLRKYR